MVRIVITGHTDTVGSERYNQALSERRAGAAKAEIVRLGLDARDINADGCELFGALGRNGPWRP